jgi:Zn finger protein HypA/HybF involved in hydrogenase expression
MARFRAKLKELKNANVNYISLVDRAATRIPFRVLKQEKGDETLDLTKIFKADRTPEVVAVVVRDPGDAELVERVRAAVQDVGFSTETVRKGENVTIFEQKETPEDAQLIRLSENVVVAVQGFHPANGEFEDMVSADGFFNGISGAFAVVQKGISDTIQETADENELRATVSGLLNNLSEYVTALVDNVPTQVFKAEHAIEKAVKSPKTQSGETKCPGCKATVDKDAAKCPKCGMTLAQKQDEPEDKPAEGTPVEGEVIQDPVVEEPVEEKPAEGEQSHSDPNINSQKPNESNGKEPVVTKKSDEGDLKSLLSTMQSIATQMEGLSTNVENVASAQQKQQILVDDLVKKSDTLNEKLGAVVAAPPRAGDVPQNGHVRKSENEDSDPRTGFFDTAYLPRRQRTTR